MMPKEQLKIDSKQTDEQKPAETPGNSAATDASDAAVKDPEASDAESKPADKASEDEPEAAAGTPAPDAAADTKAEPEAAGTDRPAADYKAAFGDVEGSVLFCNNLSFEQSCVQYISDLKSTIAGQKEQIGKLESLSAAMATDIHGTTDPIDTDDEGESPTVAGKSQRMSTGKAKYSAALKLPA